MWLNTFYSNALSRFLRDLKKNLLPLKPYSICAQASLFRKWTNDIRQSIYKSARRLFWNFSFDLGPH